MADGVIGSVGVAVVPDAQNFWRDFEAKTRGQAEQVGKRAGESIRRAAQAEVDRGVTIRATADTRQARAELDALQRKGSQSSAGLIKTLLPLAPALVPLAGAAAAAGAGLAALGVTGVLAFKGAQAEIKAGTAEGVKFAAGVGEMKTALAGLEATAAHGVLGGFEQSITSLTAQFPELNTQTAAISQQLGDIGSHLIGGLAGGFQNFGPLIQQVLGYVDQLSGKFESWASGPGGASFAEALGADFKQAVPVLADLATAAVHLVSALNSSGQGGLGFLSQFSSLAAHIPVGLIEAGTTAYLAFRAAVTVTAGLTAASTALKGFAASEALAASAGGALAARTAGGLAAVIGRAAPYVAALVAADYATQSLVKSNNSWSQSNNSVKREIGNVGAELKALGRFDFGDVFTLSSAKANAAQHNFDDMVGHIATSVNRVRDLERGTSMAKWFSDAPYAAQNLREVNQGAKLLAATLSGTSVNLGTASQSISQYQTSLANAAAGEEKWLTQGDKTKTVIAGAAVYTGTWAAALEQSGGDASKAAFLIAAHADALRDDQKAALAAAQESARLSDAISGTAAKYHLTADQVSLYGAAIGVNAQQIASGEVSTRDFAAAVGIVSRAFANGNGALQGWLTDLGKIDLTSNTLTTRVSLLGAGLKALQGVTLDMAGANLQAASSSEDAANAIAQHKNVIGENGQLLGQLVKTTQGYIVQQPKLTANALQVEQAMSQAGQSAITLAQNIYQNTGSAKKAGDAYYGLRQQFVNTLEQMGYFPGKAKKIADSVYGIPDKKFVSFLQKGDLPDAIRNLSRTLTGFTRQFQQVLVHLGIVVPESDRTGLRDVVNTLTSINGKTFTANVAVNTPSSHDVSGPIFGGGKADGGPITAGTGPRADDVLIRASRGEYVINAAQTAKHYNLIESINKGTAGFADGGQVGGPSLVTDATGKKKSTAKTSVQFDLSLLSSFVGTAVNAQSNPLVDALNSIFASARSAKAGLSAGFISELRGQNRELIGLTNERDRVATQLQNAQQKLADLRANYKQEVSTVKGAYQSTFNVAQAGTGSLHEPVTISGILRQARQAARDARAFTGILGKLRREGLSTALIQQLAEAGPAAIAEARALASATPKQILALNASEATIQRQGAKGGHTAAEDMYRAGIDSANGLVQGLRSRESALRTAVRELAQQMVSEIRSTLGIHSPSRVAMELGGHFGEGMALGVAGKHGAVAAQANRLALALSGASQPANSFGGGMAGGGSFSFVQHNHHPVAVTSGPSTPDAIRAAVNLLGRR